MLNILNYPIINQNLFSKFTFYSGISVGGSWIRHRYQKCSMAYENNEQTMTMLSLFIP